MNEYITVKKFAETAPDLYSAMKEYNEHCLAERGAVGKKFSTHSKDVMEKAINKEFAAELTRRTSMTPESHFDGSLQRYSSSTIVKEFADAIRNYMIDMILPETLDTGVLRYFADFRYEGLGDSMTFDIENNALFTVSEAGYRLRNTNLQKLFKTSVTLVPKNYMITTGSDLFEILTGRASIAKDAMKAVRSLETKILFSTYDAIRTSMDSLTGNLMVANYTEKALIKACETVTAYNQGRKAIILGTPVALKSVLPSNANYRYLLDDEYVKLGRLQNFNGYDVIPLEQIADPYNPTAYSLKLDDTQLYIISPASDKLAKIGIGGDTMSHTDAIYDNANLLQMNTISKAYDVKVITNSVAAVIKSLE